MNIQLLLDGLFLESLKVDYTVTSLGKVKRSFITQHTHTHTGYIPLWVVREIVPLFLISFRIESLLLPSSEILTYV